MSANEWMNSTASSGSSVTCNNARSVVEIVPDGSSVSRIHSSNPDQWSRPDEHDREVADLAGLDERERLEQLVHRAEAAGQDHETVGVLHEHHLAGEEVAELDAEVDVLVEPLLVRQLDVAPDGQAATLAAAAVGGLHRARTAAGDHRVARSGEHAGRSLRASSYVG